MSDRPSTKARDLHLSPGTFARAVRQVYTGDSAPHAHSFFEIVFTLHGSGLLHTSQGDTHLHRGTVILLPPGTVHTARGCQSLNVYHCCFAPPLLRRELSWCLLDPSLNRLFTDQPAEHPVHLHESDLQGAVAHLDEVALLHNRTDTAHGSDLVARLLLLLGILARAANDTAERPVDPLTHPAVADALRILDTQTTREWTLTDLADVLRLTPSYLSRLFKDHTGLPPMAYLARRRAEQAAELLACTDATIAEIAEHVGWSDQNYFARRFKAHFGLTPSEYRQGLGVPSPRGPRAEQRRRN
ncbi:AraC family transcriptional regulator [Streptomyces sp. NPDC096057]|uniref:helix-turn-helix transcriptional regulator n=1 Tax=Streptomyces sp. NPDC096057 TaxID=3155543 RepID=UPI00331F0362